MNNDQIKAYMESADTYNITSHTSHLIDGIPQSVHDTVIYKTPNEDSNSMLEKCIRTQLMVDPLIKVNWGNDPDIELIDQSFISLPKNNLRKARAKKGIESHGQASLHHLVPTKSLSKNEQYVTQFTEQNQKTHLRYHVKHLTFGTSNYNFIPVESSNFKVLQSDDVFNEPLLDLTSLLIGHGLILPRLDYKILISIVETMGCIAYLNKIAWCLMYYHSIWSYSLSHEDFQESFKKTTLVFSKDINNKMFITNRLRAFTRQMDLNLGL
jgi:hypothetical protein